MPPTNRQTGIFTTRATLQTLLATALDPTPVYLGEPSGLTRMTYAFLAGSRHAGPDGTHSVAGLRPSPQPRNEQVLFDVVVHASRSKPEDSESDAADIIGVVMETVSENANLSSLAGLMWIRNESVDVVTEWDEGHSVTTASVTFEIMSRVGVA